MERAATQPVPLAARGKLPKNPRRCGWLPWGFPRSEPLLTSAGSESASQMFPLGHLPCGQCTGTGPVTCPEVSCPHPVSIAALALWEAAQAGWDSTESGLELWVTLFPDVPAKTGCSDHKKMCKSHLRIENSQRKKNL